MNVPAPLTIKPANKPNMNPISLLLNTQAAKAQITKKTIKNIITVPSKFPFMLMLTQLIS